MKKIIIISVLLLILFYVFNKESQQDKDIVEKYPWQVSLLPDGRTRVFGIVFNETSLKTVDEILKSSPTIALFESKDSLSLEAYYKNVTLAGLIGSFIFSLDASVMQLNEIKTESKKQNRTANNGIRYELDKDTSEKTKELRVTNLIYIPTVQLDEETIIKRFGQPDYKIKLETKEQGWHYLYPEKGLDLIFKEEGKEVLQYVLPKNFNLLLEPLQSSQSLKH